MAQAPSSKPLLEVRGMGKRFPGVRALHNVDLRLETGEVLAVLGENGAGKSTLMKILAGVQPADEGELLIDGEVVEIQGVQDALANGIALIHQELNLATNLSVGGNIFLGREPLKRGLIDEDSIRKEAERFLSMVGLEISPDDIVEDLTIGRQQMVEIAKALSVDARILIMDEPTSSLSQKETENLFEVVKQLRDRGVSVIYISHRLSEVKELADRVTILRDGENAGHLAKEEINHDAMVRMMVGRDIEQFYVRTIHEAKHPALEIRDVQTPAHPREKLNFVIRAGEVVGMAGLVGAGRTEMLQTVFGFTPAFGGEILVEGKPVQIHTPMDAIQAGLALVPEDRKEQGLILDMTVRENMSLAALKRDAVRGIFRNQNAEDQITTEMIESLRVKTPHPDQIIRYLSGGNQQKVVIGKWLAMKPKVLLLDEPTRGIDIGAKQEIYNLMEELAGQGVAVLFISSEMEEVLNMADRALVMHEGRIAGELSRDELSEEAVMQLATGATSPAAAA
ncbi:MAG: ribose transport system ATP-binding protein [Verrucomicrobiales bacterium]|jgi:ribose transport system ATP-binding protein